MLALVAHLRSAFLLKSDCLIKIAKRFRIHSTAAVERVGSDARHRLVPDCSRWVSIYRIPTDGACASSRASCCSTATATATTSRTTALWRGLAEATSAHSLASSPRRLKLLSPDESQVTQHAKFCWPCGYFSFGARTAGGAKRAEVPSCYCTRADFLCIASTPDARPNTCKFFALIIYRAMLGFESEFELV